MEQKDFITIQEAAHKIGVTTIHFRKMLERGVFPTINVAQGKIRRSLRIKNADIESFIKAGGVSA